MNQQLGKEKSVTLFGILIINPKKNETNEKAISP
jgi:hypothetical protein